MFKEDQENKENASNAQDKQKPMQLKRGGKARLNLQSVSVLTSAIKSCKVDGNIQNHEVDPSLANRALQEVQKKLFDDVLSSSISDEFKVEAHTIIPQSIDRVREKYRQSSDGESNESPSKKAKRNQESAQAPEEGGGMEYRDQLWEEAFPVLANRSD
jgi:hypothetical protein